jgi:predicted RNase H-like nuclease (RuvC/YqgF family)
MFAFLKLVSIGLLAPDDGGAGGAEAGSEQPEEKTGGAEQNEKDQQLESLKAELEELRKNNSSKDKSVTKLNKELEELKKAQMSEEERKAAEEKERTAKEAEERKSFLHDVRTIAAERAGLEEKDAALIPGDDPEQIRENGKRLKELLEAQFSAGFEKAKKEGMNGGTPKGGADSTAGAAKKLTDLFKG